MARADPRVHQLQGLAPTAGAFWQPALALYEQTEGNAVRSHPVLYVHGATFGAETSVFFKFGGTSWADALNAAGFSVWALDFAGFGRSARYLDMAADAPQPGAPLGRADDAARQIARAVDAIRAATGADKVSIVAHSWGTQAAGRFAVEHSERVDRIVMFGPVTRREILQAVPPLGPWRFVTLEDQRRRFVEDVPAGAPAVLAEADFPAWSAAYLGSDATSVARTPPSVKTPNGPTADIMAAWSGSLAYDPARITTPVAIVRGTWDSLCRDADAAWLLANLTSSPEKTDIKIPNATHLMHLEVGRTALYEATNRFLLKAR